MFFRSKNIMNRPATLCEILVVKFFASKGQIGKHCQKRSLLTHADAVGDKELFMTINRAFQILAIDDARDEYNLFGLDAAGKIINDEN